LPGWESPDGLLPIWSARAARQKKSETAYLEFGALADCLNGRDLPASAFRDPASLYGFEDKVGIAVDPVTFVAADEMIYSTRMLALAHGVHLYAEVSGPQGCGLAAAFFRPSPMGFGGESRYVVATAVKPVSWPWASGERSMWMLAAPALFAGGWRPDVLPEGSRLVAAAVDGPFAVSGWDMAQGGPKPSRFGVRAGSVYFSEGGAPGVPVSLCACLDDVQQGYGFCLKGTWSYA
jgi:CRISPR-associated protein Cmr3